jgi:hypothetical protein
VRVDILLFQNPIGKIIERGKIDTPIIQIHDRSLSCLGTDRSIKSGGVKLTIDRGIDFASFYNFSNWVLEMFRQWYFIFYFIGLI